LAAIRSCVEGLSDEQVWWRPNDASNSIGNLILHLNGNVRQWLVSSFNGLATSGTAPPNFENGDQSLHPNSLKHSAPR
jgi:Protein of unknown function (DUF664)